MSTFSAGRLFLVSALILLLAGLLFGLLAAMVYIKPDFLKSILGFESLRPLHVTMVLFWILMGATGCVLEGLQAVNGRSSISKNVVITQWLLWIIAICGIVWCYSNKHFGGREYWEFDPIWALPIAISWLLFVFTFFKSVRHLKDWPVYVWMWMTGILFFCFTFTENYLWLFPSFRESFITDMTIQWKVNGSMVGAWNQLLYGTAFFLMDRINPEAAIGKSKVVFGMYFLGMFNLLFNWGHHIYTLPTAPYVQLIAYGVSMTEWVLFIRTIWIWKRTMTEAKCHAHYFPYRFLLAADAWVFLNLGQALLMSIPALNVFTHGTHITVAHAMGTTVGINTMILLAACFVFLANPSNTFHKPSKLLNFSFWLIQGSLLVFWFSLNAAGVAKGIWQLSVWRTTYAEMMQSLSPWFRLFAFSGGLLLIGLSIPAIVLLRNVWKEVRDKT